MSLNGAKQWMPQRRVFFGELLEIESCRCFVFLFALCVSSFHMKTERKSEREREKDECSSVNSKLNKKKNNFHKHVENVKRSRRMHIYTYTHKVSVSSWFLLCALMSSLLHANTHDFFSLNSMQISLSL